jgi:hypothetical protein
LEAGINATFMDAADIAWKLALVLRGKARPSLLDTYAIERGMADCHVLEVSNEIHTVITGLVATFAAGGTPGAPPSTSDEVVSAARRQSMLDVSYAGSPIVGRAGEGSRGPAPGERFPANRRLKGESHHLLVVGPTQRLDRMRARWDGLVTIVDASAEGFNATEAGAPDDGAVLIRPDGFIGFRATPANDVTMAALDAHLERYLVPTTGGDRPERYK